RLSRRHYGAAPALAIHEALKVCRAPRASQPPGERSDRVANNRPLTENRRRASAHVGRGMRRMRAALGAALALVLLVQPLATEAQRAGKVWRIGLISVAYLKIEDVFFQHLRELGYVEGQSPVVERRYSEGPAERFPEFVAALVRLNLDMIVAPTTPAALAVKKATTTIPVVLPQSIDPVGSGLVASLARPGGNITGTTQAPELGAKRLQL